jgi:hypothetical protein
MALFDFPYARRMEREDDDTVTFVVPSASGRAVPVGEWIDLEHPDEVLSENRLAKVAAARAEAHAAQA